MLATLSSILQRRQNLIKPLIALSNNSNNLEVGSYCFNKCKWHSLTGRCNWIFLINLFAEWSHDWLFRLLTYREFFYIQMEKYARQALSEGVKSETELHVTEDSELYRVINVHYNRNNHIEVSLVKKLYFFGVYWFTWSGKAESSATYSSVSLLAPSDKACKAYLSIWILKNSLWVSKQKSQT